MEPKKLLTTLALVSVVLIAGCKKDTFVEIPGICPIVISTVPANLATGVPLNQVITATFNKVMNPATITQASFTVKGASAITGTVSYSGTTATFVPSPSTPLIPNTTYTGTILKSVKDLIRQSPKYDYVWTFTTINTDTVTFNKNGGDTEASPTSMTAVSGGNVGTLPTPPTRTGYTFDSWNTASNGSGTAFTASTAVTADVTVYAKWTANNNTITFDGNTNTGGSTAAQTLASYATANLTINGFTKTGYTFAGWATTAVGAVAYANQASYTMGTANVTLYAQWTAVTYTYTVTFDKQGGSGTTNPITGIAYNATVTLPAPPTKDLNTFGGWYTEAAGAGTVFDETTAVTADVTVYAKWTLPAPFSPVVDLKTAGRFGILAGVGVTNDAGFSVINNLDVGIYPGARTSVTGFPPATVVPSPLYAIYAADDIDPPGTSDMLRQAKQDLTDAYLFAEGATDPAPATVSGNQGGLTLYPGIYKSESSLLIAGSPLYLDARGDPNATWIFQIGSTLTTTTGGDVILTGSAMAKNVFWQVGSSATIGTYTSFKGNVLALSDITMAPYATAEGRMLARNGTVKLNSTNIITKPLNK